MCSYGNSAGKRSALATEGDRMEGFRMIEMPFSPLLNTWSDTDDMDELFISPRDYGSRQAYLRSYTFTRAEPNAKAPEKVKKSLLRLKAAAWAVVACKYRLPLRARILKERMIIKSSQYLSNGVQYLRPSCVQMPKCLMAGA
ncbi:hypothetical protein KC19_4G051500 [Ceratodon purpureus]|uniref:Uncharacterized protein n=1 Tax=Ceratodon purpureus TaxID=3225 RepID=A0A8T0I787_CERPU|nr:hypothetical protein KC19_4G051500 [Ceratodon purpureus]